MPALYRTYRPKTFSQVVGQSYIVRTLRNAVIHGKPSHAYLFCGGRGLGKTTLARVLARALNCPSAANGEACLECGICKQFDTGTFLDLIEVDAASNTGVDNVRSLIDTIHFEPTAGTYKVYIIDEAHMLSKGAWNALLKTLEEPPAHTVFILATTESAKVPATINSRAQRFDFPKFSEQDIAQQLQSVLAQEKVVLDEAIVRLITRLAGGGMRDALTLLDQALSLGSDITVQDVEQLLGVTDEEVLLKLLEHITHGNTAALPDFITDIAVRYVDIAAVNRDLLDLLGRLLYVRFVPGAGKAQLSTLVEASTWCSEQEFLFLIRQFLRSYKEIGTSPRAELPLLIASLEAALKFNGSQGQSVGHVSTHVTPAAPAKPVSPSVSASASPVVPQSPPIAQVVVSPGVVSQSASGIVLTQDLMDAHWPEVLKSLKEANGPLSTLVRNSPICSIEGNCITLGVKYLFHKEQLESIKNRQLLSNILEKEFGSAIRIQTQFLERTEETVEVAETLSAALKVFSGELVE